MNAQIIASAGRVSRVLTVFISSTILSLSGVFAFADETAPADAPAQVAGSSFESSVSGGYVNGGGGSLGR